MSDKLKILSPFDGHLISEIEWDDAKKLEHALATAHLLTQNPDRTLAVPQRIEILERAAKLVEDQAEKFARQAAEEGGKPLIDSRVELDRAVQGIREAAQSISRLTGREIPMNLTASSMNRMAYTRREKTRCLCWRRAAFIMRDRSACPCNACLRMSPSSMPSPGD